MGKKNNVKMLKDVKVELKKERKFYDLKEGEEHEIGSHELQEFLDAGYCVTIGKPSKEVKEDKAVKGSVGGK